MTVASEKSVSNRSALRKVVREATPAASALRFESSTISGLYSMPTARAPSFAALMTVRPSPDPRSKTTSWAVVCAIDSMVSTSACDVGTHTTSFPA